MRFSDLESYLAQTPLAPLWVITGEEPLLMLEAADLLRAKAREEGATERDNPPSRMKGRPSFCV